MLTQKTWREESPPTQLWLHFYMFFLLPLVLPYVNWASQECCLFYLRSSLPSLDLPLSYFLRLFPSLSFSHCHFWTPLSYSNYLTYSWRNLSRGEFSIELGQMSRVKALANWNRIPGFTSMDTTNWEWKILQKKKCQKNCELQNLNLLHARNYLHDSYILFTTIYVAFTLY